MIKRLDYGGVGSCTEEEFKMIKLSLDPDRQVEQTKSLGLKLTITPSFLHHINTALAELSVVDDVDKTNRFLNQLQREKLKASNFPALRLIIGNYERSSMHKGNLIAKFYYAKKRILWEVLEGATKIKMEMQWSHIEAIKATIQENEPGILEIEINRPPIFCKEINPHPRKHTLWQTTSDFTGGQALICRRHRVEFPPGALDKHYEKLLESDQRLLELSRKPFPSGKCPYFPKNCHNCNNNIARPRLYYNSNLTANSTSQGTDFGQGEEDNKSYMQAKVTNQGETAQNIYLLHDQIQGLAIPGTEDQSEGQNQINSQFIQRDDYFPQAQSIHSNTNMDMDIDEIEYILNNFDYGNSLTNISENLDPHSGLIWPLPISSRPAQVSDDDATFAKGLPQTFSNLWLEDYGADNNSYFGAEWS